MSKNKSTDRQLMAQLIVATRDVMLATGIVLRAAHKDFGFASAPASVENERPVIEGGVLTIGMLKKLQIEFNGLVKKMGEIADPKDVQ